VVWVEKVGSPKTQHQVQLEVKCESVLLKAFHSEPQFVYWVFRVDGTMRRC
jgi:hypothetical protein